ncbi:uncharacterized protein LOC111067703 [Drosophila obscura]|uniref:uncharacterized protein LOC111067703 n=1 Tax=Drosophila obscura TaxID=7282 RepID=UPI001BB22F5D|nr:uncharacterized protein LOC111067703 [Drosophila obscura]
MMINYLVFGITCLISVTAFLFVAEAASLRNVRPRLTLSMASQSRSAMQSMREFALYMGPKGLATPEELARQRAMDFPFVSAGQRQLLAEDEDLPYDLRSQLPEFQAKQQNAGLRRVIKCRRKADGSVERDGNSDADGFGSDPSDFEGCHASDDDLSETSGAAYCDLIAIRYLFSIISLVPLVPLLF